MVWRMFEPFAELSDLRRQFDSLVDRVGTDTGLWRGAAFPALNVWEEGDSLHVEAELPGLSGKDVDITVNGNELTIKGARRPCDEQGVSFHRRERATAEFSRTVTLPFEVDQEGVQAQIGDGVLHLALPKAAKLKARKIDVKVGA